MGGSGMSDLSPRKYDPIALSSESTVVAEYIPNIAGASSYQSEADLERELIRLGVRNELVTGSV